jgi:hypothetical protein
MKKVINLVVRIEYDYGKEFPKVSEKYNDLTAVELAINPNFNTVEEGVSLDKVQVETIEPYTLIDWDKIEHNPQISLTK